MKKIILTAILGLFLICGLKAQAITLPTFTGKTVMVKTLRIASYSKNYITINDGAAKYVADINPEQVLTKKMKEEGSNELEIVWYIDQIIAQGYKLTFTYSFQIAESQAVVEYLFQKD